MMDLLQGFNSISSQPLNTAITGTIGAKTGGQITSSVSLCTDTESVFHSLEVDAGASVAYGPYSASAKTQFVKSMQLTTNSVVLVVYTAVSDRTSSKDWDLKPGLESSVETPTGLADFVNRYGDSFVSEVITGSEYYAAFVFYSESLEEKQRVMAAIEGQGTVGGATISANLKTEIQDAMSSLKISKKLFQGIGGFSSGSAKLPALEVDQIIDFALNFTTLRPDAPEALGIVLTGYEKVFSSAVNFKPVIANRRAFLGTPDVPGWWSMHQKLDALKNQVAQIETLYAFYDNVQDPDLSTKREQIQSDIQRLEAFLDDVADEPTIAHSFTPPTPPVSLTYGSPQADFDLVILPGWGGNGGGSFQDISPDDVLRRVRIKQLDLSHGDRIDMLTTTYETASGDSWTTTHGSPGGGTDSLKLSAIPPEFITEVEGWGLWDVHNVLNRLNFKTSRGQAIHTYDPSSNDPSTPWKYAKGDGFLIGFAGRSGADLDKLQPIIVRFKPTAWLSDLNVRSATA